LHGHSCSRRQDAGAQYRYFRRQLNVFQHPWIVAATLSEPSDVQSRAWCTVEARADNWQVEATHEVLIWDDTVRCDFDRLFRFGCSMPRAAPSRCNAQREL
jgi:hypothetical protein